MDIERYKDPAEGLSVLTDQSQFKLEFTYEVRVPARLVKLAFYDMQPLMRKTAHSKSLSIACQGNCLVLRSSTSLILTSRIPIQGDVPDKEIEVVCMYEEIADLLPLKGELLVTITPAFVKLQTDSSEITLTSSNDEIDSEPEIEGEVAQIALSDLKVGLKNVLSLGAISSVFKTGNIVVLSGDFMHVKYPTVWVETKSSGLETRLDVASAHVLEQFIRSAREVHVFNSREFVAIKKEFSTLFIPSQSTEDVESIEEFISDFTLIDTVSIAGLSKDCQSLTRTIGKADCKIAVFDRGLIIESSTPSITASVQAGNPKESTRLLDVFTTRLEFFNNLLPILGETVKIYRKGDWICIKGHQALAIVSSR